MTYFEEYVNAQNENNIIPIPNAKPNPNHEKTITIKNNFEIQNILRMRRLPRISPYHLVSTLIRKLRK